MGMPEITGQGKRGRAEEYQSWHFIINNLKVRLAFCSKQQTKDLISRRLFHLSLVAIGGRWWPLRTKTFAKTKFAVQFGWLVKEKLGVKLQWIRVSVGQPSALDKLTIHRRCFSEFAKSTANWNIYTNPGSYACICWRRCSAQNEGDHDQWELGCHHANSNQIKC